MAPPAGHIQPGRYLASFVLIVVALYALVFLTGDHKPTPKLGIDLKGGTQVTLKARTPDGGDPSRESLNQARQIIETRVNGIGISGTEVVLDGTNIVITVPGEGGEQAKTLGKTAKLGFRKVIFSADALQLAAGAGAGGGTTGGASTGKLAPEQQDDPLADEETRKQIAEAKQARQSPDLLVEGEKGQKAQEAALKALDCSKRAGDPLFGNDDPKLPLVACDQNRGSTDPDNPAMTYLLGPVILDGQKVSDAGFGPRDDGTGYQVNLTFTSEGNKEWSQITSEMAKESAANPNNPARVAFVLDTEVVSAPSVTEAIPGNTRITGDFRQQEAKDLSDVLKYGSLPLSFASEEAKSVSATLGLASLKAGLMAGGIGLILVFLYCLVYYRLLGVLTVLSLALSGAIVYAVLILLGRWIGFTLDLAGVAGLIIAIGITADSFVVFFERLKDEVREGKTFRSAVPRGWVRARRTILASDAVMFLAAGVLYVLAVGQVKGFAFTLGMSTVLDLIVVFLVTHPLVTLASKSPRLSKPRFSGLGGVQTLGARRRAALAVKEA